MELQDEKNSYVDKKYFSFAIFIICLLCVTLFLIGYFRIEKKIDNLSTQKIPGNNIEQDVFEPNKETIVYKVMAYNGKIGVFKNDSILYCLDVYLFTLPEEDKKLLEKGIVALNEEELYEILEEYY